MLFMFVQLPVCSNRYFVPPTSFTTVCFPLIKKKPLRQPKVETYTLSTLQTKIPTTKPHILVRSSI